MFDRPVLGIDPGLSRCGYGAVVQSSGRARATACGVIRTDPADPLPRRLARLADELDALLDDVDPSAVAVERVLFQANTRTAMSVGQASGLALLAAARRGVEVVEYSPNEVKLAVTGDGTADKVAVQAMIVRLLRLERTPSPPDAADALAVALTHAWRARTASGRGDDATTARTGYETAVEAALARQVRR